MTMIGTAATFRPPTMIRTPTLLGTTARVDLGRLDDEAVLTLLAAHDLRGHGGAGFPTATKIRSARGGRPRLIINACDGEPLVGKDTALLQQVPGLLADGIALVARITGAREVVIAAHRGSPGLAAVPQVLAAAPLRVPSRALPVPDRYVASEASALASLAAGGEARPVTRTAPLTTGGPGRTPVLVLNAETVARVAWLCLHPEAPPTRLITVAGAVRSGGVRELPLGTSLGAVVEAAGSTSRPRAVLVGGFAGRWLPWDEASSLSLAGLGHDLGAGLVFVQGADCPHATVAAMLRRLAAETAGQCGPCMFGLPAVADDWAQLDEPAGAVAARVRLDRRLPLLAGRGACHHPDGVMRMAASALVTFDDHLRSHAAGRCA